MRYADSDNASVPNRLPVAGSGFARRPKLPPAKSGWIATCSG
ncbi:MAG TPA: hypothetical protein VLG08_05525 [Casimicrobiaceae bacterium]|nr:hypothetical protein [Casimicrobiaceae bacterium]